LHRNQRPFYDAGMPTLQLYRLHRVFPIYDNTPDHYIIGYKDRIVGSLYLANSGPRKEWLWSLYDATPQSEWRRGTEPSYREAKSVIGQRFRKWIEEEGDPKPYVWRQYQESISEKMAE